MAHIKCGNRDVSFEHYHESVDLVRDCFAATLSTSLKSTVAPAAALPAPVPSATMAVPGAHTGRGGALYARAVIHTSAPSTEQQRSYARHLGGDYELASSLNRGQCADYIDRLKSAKEGAKVEISSSSPVFSPPSTKVPVELLSLVPEGYYAVRPDANTRWSFIRVSRPKRGKWAGTLKIQTQHGDNLDLAFAVYPSGTVKVYSSKIEDDLLLLIPNRAQAMVDYGREIGRCCCCGKTLTDEESRYYGQGPECAKHYPEIRAHVDALAAEEAGV